MTLEQAKSRLVIAALVFLLVGYSEAGRFADRQDRRDAQVAACARGLLDRADSIDSDNDTTDTNVDAAGFDSAASSARRADGNSKVADSYARFADRATARAGKSEQRARSRSKRLLGGDLAVLLQRKPNGAPTLKALAEAHGACSRVNPPPHLIGF